MGRYRGAPTHPRIGGAQDQAGICEADRGRPFCTAVCADSFDYTAGGAQQFTGAITSCDCAAAATDYHECILKVVDTCMPVEKVCSIDEMACRLMGTERQVPVARKLALTADAESCG